MERSGTLGTRCFEMMSPFRGGTRPTLPSQRDSGSYLNAHPALDALGQALSSRRADRPILLVPAPGAPSTAAGAFRSGCPGKPALVLFHWRLVRQGG